MKAVTQTDARAILRAEDGLSRFHLSTAAPSPVVAPFVENYWIVSWDLRGRQPHRQAVLPYPAVNMTFKPGRSRISGVIRGHFDEQLEGAGRVVGVRFRPGGFQPFLDAPVSTITDRFLALDEVFGAAGSALERSVLAAPADSAVAHLDSFLATRAPSDPTAVNDGAAIVEQIAADPGLLRTRDLARRLGVSGRSLQRLFAAYVGVGPKWVIQRFRLHEAAVRIARAGADWARLAGDLGYSDQPHSSAISPLRSAALRPGTPATAPSRECDRT